MADKETDKKNIFHTKMYRLKDGQKDSLQYRMEWTQNGENKMANIA